MLDEGGTGRDEEAGSDSLSFSKMELGGESADRLDRGRRGEGKGRVRSKAFGGPMRESYEEN